ncbi:MAG: 3,4-dihydroxy-2-butanone-4-phosphate synthase [Thermoplasmata archaeon]|nr:3,4-dihydroxy-2-butanone-4-phosphate synthase [Thermoplasmata archaeon]
MFKDALEAVASGKFVLVYDADEREHETDFVICSQFVTPEHVRQMRKEGGGLICVTVPPEFWEAVGLPYLTDVFPRCWDDYRILKVLEPYDIPYDAKSSFSVTINHRKTFTGITDRDRALTISEFGRCVNDYFSHRNPEDTLRAMKAGFRSPGHVPLLNASKGLVTRRQGHTELATALMVMAGVAPSAAICEIMADDGYAMKKVDAWRYAQQNDLIFVEGKEIIEAWRNEGRDGFGRV